MGTTSWREQIDRALKAIDHLGESKYRAKQEQGWQPGQSVLGLYRHGHRRLFARRQPHLYSWDGHDPIGMHAIVTRAITCRNLGPRRVA